MSAECCRVIHAAFIVAGTIFCSLEQGCGTVVDNVGNNIIRDLTRIMRKDRKRAASRGGASDLSDPEIRDVVSFELVELLERVRTADVVRKDRVHRVIERLKKDELVTSESVREAAERMIEKGI